MDSFILGVDIGGSHITAAMTKPEQKLIVQGSWSRKRVNAHGTAQEIIQSWCDALLEVFLLYPVKEKKIGIAMPGPFDYKNGISYIKGLDKYEALYEQNVRQQMAEYLQIPVKNILMMNDAAAFLRGEVVAGAAQGYKEVIGLTLGTGTGTARHHNGITEDANLGPSPFMDSIADNYFSTRWFVKRYAELSGVTVKDVKELTALFATNEQVRVLFHEFTDNLVIFLKQFIETDQPEAIVLGGNIALAADLFLPELEQKLAQQNRVVPILKAQLGEEAAILGAASLFTLSSARQVIL